MRQIPLRANFSRKIEECVNYTISREVIEDRKHRIFQTYFAMEIHF